jgi:hypothetical protein
VSTLTFFQKRKRREYRQSRKEQFKRPVESTYSLYEGRTRGKRMKYTYSDDDDDGYSDSTATRRSTRNTGTHTPVEPAGPTVTLSGRQVKSRVGGMYGETILSGNTPPITTGGYDGADEGEDSDIVGRRPRRAAANGTNGSGKGGRHIEGCNSVDEMDEEDEASEEDYGDDEDEHVEAESEGDEQESSDEDMEMDEDDAEVADAGKQHKLVMLKVKTPTPEKVRTVKLDVDPKSHAIEDASTIISTDIVAGAVEPTPSNGVSTEAAVHLSSGEKQTEPTAPIAEGQGPAHLEATNKPIPSPEAAAAAPTAPLSPSLARPESPEQTHAVPPAPIDVGASGI